MSHVFRSLVPVLVLLVSAPLARADFLDGRAVHADGTPAPNVNLDLVDLATGNPATLSGDLTDANGFFHVTAPAGTFRLVFNPPQPPASTDLYTTIEPVTLSGTTNVGTVALLPGVALSGRVVNASNVGVAGVNFDVVRIPGGENVRLLYDVTDALGNFSFAVPAALQELRLDPSSVVGATLAPRTLELEPLASLALGDVALAPGFVVTAIVRGPNGAAVASCDAEAVRVPTEEHLFTPSDDTNATGLVDFVVPAGTYDFEFCPPTAARLANGRVPNVTISANATLGVVTLQPGRLLSGTVVDAAQQPVLRARLALRNDATGAAVSICNDRTDAAGHYATVVPPGTFRVSMLPPDGQVLGTDVHFNVAVSADRVLDGALPPAFPVVCAADGTTASACPCGNYGAPGHGCSNSQRTAGARLVALGSTALDPATGKDALVLAADGLTSVATVSAIFLQSTALDPVGTTFGDGVLCLTGTLIRIGSKPAPIGIARYP
ncbi:MAG: hypothetical protein IPJ77_21045 [Planctomycetes bacterium]|nr:hypothetical protein [Planctomycetota bacterium]